MKPQNVECPDCGGEMTPRTSAHGKFWGCKAYPKCKGTRNSDGIARRTIDRQDERQDEARLPSERWAGNDRRRWNQ
jgi:DNA topoisomerase-1